MGLMDSLITSTTMAAPKVIAYGAPGVGKTTFAASAKGLLLDCENGAGVVPGLSRTPYLETWPQMRKWLIELAGLKESPRVVAIDTIDWMIQRISEYVVCELDVKDRGNITNTLGSSHGGYFKAREIVQNIVYRELLPMLNAINANGVAILLLAHAVNTKLTTPEGFDIRVATPDLPSWIMPPFIEWADAVLYAKNDGGTRTMRTEATNLILAKNRYSLPAELPLSWHSFEQAINNTNGE